MKKKILFFMFYSVLIIGGLLAQTTVTVYPNQTYQVHEGFGTSLCWFGNVVGNFSEVNRTQIANLLFSKSDGIALNVVRYNIGGGDDPSHEHMRPGAEMEGFLSAYGTWDWNADAGQRWMLQAAKSRAGSDFVAEAFSNSPPYWMTVSGCSAGNGGSDNLSSSNYQAFADYLTDVIIHFRDYWSINFKTLDPMNEPMNAWSYMGSQEGCYLSNSSQNALIKVVKSTIQSKGINIKLSAMDGTSVSTTIDAYNSYDSAAKSYIDQINAHGYGHDRKEELYSIAQNADKELWMSEADDGGTDDPWSGAVPYNPDSMTPAMSTARRITAILNGMNPSAYVMWQAVENWVNMLPIGENRNWGLILANFEGEGAGGLAAEEWRTTKKYYVFGQYSKYIRPGYVRVYIGNSNCTAFYSETDKRLVIVTQNSNTSSLNYSYNLYNFDSMNSYAQVIRTSAGYNLSTLSNVTITNKEFTSSAPGESVTTYIIDNINKSSSSSDVFDPDISYRIVNRNSGKVLTISGTNKNASAAPIQQYTDTGADYQRWKVVLKSDGYYNIISIASGQYFDINGASTADGALNIQWPVNGGLNQDWSILDQGNGYYHIVNRNSGKLLDIEGASMSDGAQNIQWPDNGGYNQDWQILE